MMTTFTIQSTHIATSIETPPDSFPTEPPIETLIQTLPFGQLTWENFERLCHRLAGEGKEVERSARYGIAGQAQQGIDILVRKKDAKYDTWQVKRYQKYTANDLKSAVEKFLAGEWADKAVTLVIAVQATLADVKMQNEIETQADILKRRGIELRVLGGEELSAELRNYPHLILDFFGRNWTRSFLGTTANPALFKNLDGEEFSNVRKQLAQVYNAQFQLLDRWAIENQDSDNAPTERGFLSRFTRPDILISEQRDILSMANESASDEALLPPIEDGSIKYKERSTSAIKRIRRVPLAGWLTQANQLSLLGDAGTGKSTLLRSIALDLTGDQTTFPELSQRWGRLIPIYVSFARWTRVAENTGGSPSLKDVVRASLQSLMTKDLVGFLDRAIEENRILLLVDGLDEWVNEQAARTSLLALQTFVATHQIFTITTGRPRGLSKIGVTPQGWATGTLAPLSIEQQRELALRCLGQRELTTEQNTPFDHTINQKVERFFRELKRESSLLPLAEIPLLLVSLLALSIRRITLPKRRATALHQLIEILLEIHPQARASAAGDVNARFDVAHDSDLRRDAIAALAYASRIDGGDSGYSLNLAKNKIRDYLTNPKTHALAQERATKAASEILAVNSETIGLLIEKAPGEIGFVHASLEEYLAAVHIQSWSLQELLRFIESYSTDPRWRNVIGNLVAIIPRASEIDEIVAVIKEKKN